ncbi:hypothetical protein F5888DRAFT_1372700 [Russula emetica]|nr:hypothetical protein F5888DRAFT_1372700 [Russula emetica]
MIPCDSQKFFFPDRHQLRLGHNRRIRCHIPSLYMGASDQYSGGFFNCRIEARAPACTAASQPRLRLETAQKTNFWTPRGLRAHLLYHPISSCLVSILSLSPLSSLSHSCTSYNSKRDGHCTLACSTLFNSISHLFALSWTTRLTWLTVIATLPGARSTITCK